MKKLVLALLVAFPLLSSAQTFVKEENDTTAMCEYHDGQIWAYRQIGDYVVGMTNTKAKDDYGRYYQITIFIKNLGNKTILFNPAQITSSIYTKKQDTLALQVYTYDEYMKKVKNAQAWALALNSFAVGMNAGLAGRQTTYSTAYHPNGMAYTQVHTTYNYAAAAAARMSATNQILTLSKMMEDDKKIISQGYLKINTLHPDEGIIGYMNIKRKKGLKMTVNIPVEDNIYSFDWDVRKK